MGEQLFHNARWDRKAYIINQRGKFEYTEEGFSLDRWSMSNCTTLILDRGVKIISNPGKRAYWSQAIEGYWLLEHQVTCSVFCADGTLFTWTIDLKTPNPFPTSKTCIYHKYCGRINLEIWVLPSNQAILFQFNTVENATEEILALKNEPGPISTLCRKDAAGNWVINDKPDPALELLKCQRYLKYVSDDPIGYGYIGARGDAAWLAVPLSVPMRTTPTLVTTGKKIAIRGNGIEKVVEMSEVRVDRLRDDKILLKIPMTGIPAYTSVIAISAEANYDLFFSAEL